MSEISIIQQLKESKQNWEGVVRIRIMALKILQKGYLNKKNEFASELKKLRKNIYTQKRDILFAKRKHNYFKQKIISLPYRIRKHNIDNIGDVFDYMEKQK
jgi:hypothetical protein